MGAFFTAELVHRFIIIGPRRASTVHSSLNVECVPFLSLLSVYFAILMVCFVTCDRVVEEPSATPGVGDNRRVSVLSEVLTDTPNRFFPPTVGKA